MGALVIKFAATGGVLSNVAGGLGQQMTEEEMKAIVETAHSFGRRVAVHSHAAAGTRAAVEAGADTIEHGTFLDDETIALMKAHGGPEVEHLRQVIDMWEGAWEMAKSDSDFDPIRDDPAFRELIGT